MYSLGLINNHIVLNYNNYMNYFIISTAFITIIRIKAIRRIYTKCVLAEITNLLDMLRILFYGISHFYVKMWLFSVKKCLYI